MTFMSTGWVFAPICIDRFKDSLCLADRRETGSFEDLTTGSNDVSATERKLACMQGGVQSIYRTIAPS